MQSPVNDDGLVGSVRSVLGRMPTSVVVVSAYIGARPWGVTASSFSSVTLDPPTVSVCLFSHTALAQAIRLQGRMGISVLSTSQVPIARRAAMPGVPKFLEYCTPEREWLTDSGLPGPVSMFGSDPHDGVAVPAPPSVHGAVAFFDCWVRQTIDVGDHDLILGQVSSVVTGDDDQSTLVYAQREFYALAASPLEPAAC